MLDYRKKEFEAISSLVDVDLSEEEKIFIYYCFLNLDFKKVNRTRSYRLSKDNAFITDSMDACVYISIQSFDKIFKINSDFVMENIYKREDVLIKLSNLQIDSCLSITPVPIFSEIKYDRKSERIDGKDLVFKLNISSETIKFLFLDPDNQDFIQTYFFDFINLSKRAFRLYCYLLSLCDGHEREYHYIHMKELAEVVYSYNLPIDENIKSFNAKFISPSCEEISKKTNFIVDWKYSRKVINKEKVKGIEFNITFKKEYYPLCGHKNAAQTDLSFYYFASLFETEKESPLTSSDMNELRKLYLCFSGYEIIEALDSYKSSDAYNIDNQKLYENLENLLLKKYMHL